MQTESKPSTFTIPGFTEEVAATVGPVEKGGDPKGTPNMAEASKSQTAGNKDLAWVDGSKVIDERSCGSCSQDSAFLQGKNWMNKRRYCLFDATNCRSGDLCTYAHSREELVSSLGEDEERAFIVDMDPQFYMNRFKTIWCPYRTKHDWQVCPYMHNYQDARRPVSIGYCSKACPDWEKSDKNAPYLERCPRGFMCPYVHGAKELLYHPDFYKTTRCLDWGKHSLGGVKCPRGRYCSFHHGEEDKRVVKQTQKVPEEPEVNPQNLPPDFHIPIHIPWNESSPKEGATAGKKKRKKKNKPQQKDKPPPKPAAKKASDHVRGTKFADRVRPDRVAYGPVDFASCATAMNPPYNASIPPAFMVPNFGEFGQLPPMVAQGSATPHMTPIPIQCYEALSIDGSDMPMTLSAVDPDSKVCSPAMRPNESPGGDDVADAPALPSGAWPDSPTWQEFGGHSPQWVFVPNAGWCPPPPPGSPPLGAQQGNPATGGIEIIGLNSDTQQQLDTFPDAKDAVDGLFGDEEPGAQDIAGMKWSEVPQTPDRNSGPAPEAD